MSWLSKAWKKVKDTVEDVIDEVEEIWEDTKDAVEDFVDDVKDSWSDAFADAKKAFEDGDILGGIVSAFGGVVAGVAGTVGAAVDLAFDVGGAIVGGSVSITGVILGGTVDVLITVVSGGRWSEAGRTIGRGISEFFDGFGEISSDISNHMGDFFQRGFDIAAGIASSTSRDARCKLNSIRGWVTAQMSKTGRARRQGIDRVDHFFVLMLENRSFDHMLGHLKNVDGIDAGKHYNSAAGHKIYAGGHAKLSLEADPPHEFSPVDVQLHLDSHNPNRGFIKAFDDQMSAKYPIPFMPEDPSEVMRAFSEDRVPILSTLAQEFAVCDKWFSSLPGPTLPNRLYAHAGTSGGLADSPSSAALVWAMTFGGFEFDNGTIFDRLTSACIDWRIYAGDATPLVMSLKGMATENVINGWRAIRNMLDFVLDLHSADAAFPRYTFIEPNYGRFWSDYKWGNSQHPLDSIVGGEELIKIVYETLRASPIWNSSALIITYDEHGGFYDHVVPTQAPPPGDSRPYESWADDPAARAFQFDRYGVRVPAVVVSPLIPKGTVDSTEYDHTSIIATISERFGLEPLTERSRHAHSLSHLFSLDQVRTDARVTLPEVNTQ